MGGTILRGKGKGEKTRILKNLAVRQEDMTSIDFGRLVCAEGTQSYEPHPKHRRCAVWGNDAPPMRFEETLQHNNQQSGVPPARRIGTLIPTPHGASLRAGLIRLRAYSTFIGHKKLK